MGVPQAAANPQAVGHFASHKEEVWTFFRSPQGIPGWLVPPTIPPYRIKNSCRSAMFVACCSLILSPLETFFQDESGGQQIEAVCGCLFHGYIRTMPESFPSFPAESCRQDPEIPATSLAC